MCTIFVLLQRNVFRQRQRREKGTIGKTMGVMAGGPFGEKVADLSVVAGEDWKGVAERVKTQYAPRNAATSGSCAAFAAAHRLIPSSTWARVRGPPVNVGARSLKNASTSARCASSQNDAPA